MLDKKTYPLKHAVAYETTIDDEDAICVVLSGPVVSAEQAEQREKRKRKATTPISNGRSFGSCSTSGDIKHWSAAAGGTMIGRRSGPATGSIKQQDGRVTGNAAVSADAQGMFPSSFDVRFDAALLKAGESLPASTAKRGGPAANVKPSVNGVFRGNGKEAKLAYVSALWREPSTTSPPSCSFSPKGSFQG